MVIELDGIVKLLGFAIAIPLTVCGIIAVVYLTVKAAQFTIYFLGKVNNARNACAKVVLPEPFSPRITVTFLYESSENATVCLPLNCLKWPTPISGLL